MSTDEKKYRLTDETSIIYGTTVYRIEALRSFANVKAGDKGGFVESEFNLAHSGNAWIANDAAVWARAKVQGDGTVRDQARVRGRAAISQRSVVKDSAEIWGNAECRGDAEIGGQAILHNHALAKGRVKIFGKAELVNDTMADEEACIYGYAKLKNSCRVEGTAHVAGTAVIVGNANLKTGKWLSPMDKYIVIGPLMNKQHGLMSWITLEKLSGIINSDLFSGRIEDFIMYADANFENSTEICFFLKSLITNKYGNYAQY